MAKYKYHGVSLNKFLNENNIPKSAVYQDIKAGMGIDEAVNRQKVVIQNTVYNEVKFWHHCPECMFLGHTLEHDMYICCGDHGDLPGVWLIARFGNESLEYSACRDGLAFGILEKAQELARRL